MAAIALTAAGMGAVAFRRSFRAARVRMAAREIVALGRYARASAVLEERTSRLRFDLAAGRIELQRARPEPPGEAPPLDEEPHPLLLAERPETFERAETPRALPEGVRIARFEGGRRPEDDTGDIRLLRFHPSGLSDDATIEIEDNAGRRLLLELDGNSGRWKVGS